MTTLVLWTLGVTLLGVTLLPLHKTHAWWVRGCDFPRLHTCLCGGCILVLTVLLMPSAWGLLCAILLGVIVFQGAQILPYTPLYPTEVPMMQGTGKPTFKILAANVLKENESHQALIDLIKTEAPDVLFLMETDTAWNERLSSILEGYKTTKVEPRDDHYGMLIATNLDVTAINFVDLANGDTPAAFATLSSPNGQGFNFVGLHPRPLLPGDDTHARDAQIRKSATIAHHLKQPIICMGDFNAVACSRTTKSFKKFGGYLDPRIGRGMFPSFNVNHPIMRFPIDQVYVTHGINLTDFRRGPDIGSDHFPMIISAYLDD